MPVRALLRVATAIATAITVLAVPLSVPSATAAAVASSSAARPHAGHRSALSFGERIVAEASRHLGAPYRWGATGPSSFDCSGFTGYVFARLGVDLPRVAADQYSATRHVSSPQIGDLVFNYGDGGIYHVGIYVGDGQMIAATHTGDVVRRESLYGSYKFGRIR